jgi:type VI protein secretion system component VasF
MNIEQQRMIELVNKYNQAYNATWEKIIQPNQDNIKLENDANYRYELQKQHDLLCTLINAQFDAFNALATLAFNLPGKSEMAWQKEYTKQLRAYIKAIGGNPSNVNFTTKNDY